MIGGRALASSYAGSRALVLLCVALLSFDAAAESGSPTTGSWNDRLYGGEEAKVRAPEWELVEGFDSASPWLCTISCDDGYATARRFPAPGRASGAEGVMGVRVDFLRRSSSSLLVRPPEPVLIGGRCSMLSLRVLGRGYLHRLSILVLDYYDKPYEISLGRLDFFGWKTLSAGVPRFDPSTGAGIVQDDAHYEREPGLRIAGIRLDFDASEAYGSFYAYFDALSALVDTDWDFAAEDGAAAPKAEGPGDSRGGAIAAPPVSVSAEPEAPVSTGGEEKKPSAEAVLAASEATILKTIMDKIAASRVYPAAAKRRGLEGTVVIEVEVDERGALISARVTASSGSDILDRAGLELLRSVFPVTNESGKRLALPDPVKITYRLSEAEGSTR
jgi:TonB family C-terminal domain